MLNPIRSIRASKAEYRRQAARAAALPEDYRFVYDKVLGYIWPFAGGTGLDMLHPSTTCWTCLKPGPRQAARCWR